MKEKKEKAISVENIAIRNRMKVKKQLLCIEKAISIEKKSIKNHKSSRQLYFLRE